MLPSAAIIAPHLIGRDGTAEKNYRWSQTVWPSNGPIAEGLCCVGFVCGAVMLFRMQVMREIGFFDEDFFLYYEDDDLCERIFSHRKEIILVPEVSVLHYSRGSVKGKNPIKSEFIRGYHHAQSKIVFASKHLGKKNAIALKWRTLMLALLTLPFRLIFLQPKYLARLIGRIVGLIHGFNRISKT
jgi:GT2 family glycosyltransferase